MAGTPELGSIRVAHLVKVLGQKPHLLLTIQANPRGSLVLVAEVVK